MKRTISTLAIAVSAGMACAASAASPAGYSDAQLMARQSLPLESWEHDAKCKFVNLPKLQVREANREVNYVASASYFVAPREAPGSENSFETLLQDSGADANWEGIYAQSGFHLHDARYARTNITRAVLKIDGRDSNLPLTVEHYSGLSVPWSTSVSVEVESDDQDPLLTALAQGRTAVLELYSNGASPAFTWTYDVSTLRELPRALRLTKWRCS